MMKKMPKFYVTDDGENIINLECVEIIHKYRDNDYPKPFILVFHMTSGRKLFVHYETEEEINKEFAKINYGN